MSLPKHRNQPKLLGHLIRRALLAAVLLAGAGVTGWTSYAAVPASVAVRQQSPEVEALIKQMEAKAALVNGTWKTLSGVQDAPASEWETYLQNNRWAWVHTAKAPAVPDLVFYFDGEDGYQAVPTWLHYQMDSLHQGKISNYRQGGYLLHLNLAPRQFLGSLPNLRIVGKERVGTEEVIHLQTDSLTDPLCQKDPAIPNSLRSHLSMELFYNSTHKSVSKVLWYQGNATKLELAVTSWDKFGTAEDWPKQIVFKTIAIGDTKITGGSDKPFVTNVINFSADKGEQFSAVEKQVAQTPFFSAPTESLRKAAFYEKALQQQEKISDRVELIQAYITEGRMGETLAQWDQLDTKLAAHPQLMLNFTLVPQAVGWVPTLANQQPQVSACAALMKRILTKNPNIDLIRSNCTNLFLAWKQWHLSTQNKSLADSIQGDLFPRLEDCGNPDVYAGLMDLAKNNKNEQTLVEPILEKVAKAPVHNFAFSPTSYVIYAAIQSRDYERAQKYLAGINWQADTPEVSKKMAESVKKAVEVIPGLRDQLYTKLLAGAELYQQFSDKPLIEDAQDAAVMRNVLIEAGVQGVTKTFDTMDHAKELVEVIRNSGKSPGVVAYMSTVMDFILWEKSGDLPWLMKAIDPLGDSLGQASDHSYTTSWYWIRISTNEWSNARLLNVKLTLLNKALAKAPDDSWRLIALKSIADSFAEKQEYTKAIEIIRNASIMLSGSDSSKQANELVKSLEEKKIANESRIASERFRQQLRIKSN